jgi:hypothetical protein
MLARLVSPTISVLYGVLISVGLIERCSAQELLQPTAVSEALGYERCTVFGSFTIDQVVAREAKGFHLLSEPSADWGAFVAKYKTGDNIYYVDCTMPGSAGLRFGRTFYALVRGNVTIAQVFGRLFN